MPKNVLYAEYQPNGEDPVSASPIAVPKHKASPAASPHSLCYGMHAKAAQLWQGLLMHEIVCYHTCCMAHTPARVCTLGLLAVLKSVL